MRAGRKPHPMERKASDTYIRAQSTPYQRSRQRLLVVDDDVLFRGFVVRALRREGYEVVDVGTAEQALRLLEEREPAFSLLLSDVSLPAASGPQLIRSARTLGLAPPALLMSGDSKAFLVRQGVVDAQTELLEKPFSATTLLAKIEQLIEAASHTLGGEHVV